jgi:formate-dependent nitrite reductase membrane component NrfD
MSSNLYLTSRALSYGFAKWNFVAGVLKLGSNSLVVAISGVFLKKKSFHPSLLVNSLILECISSFVVSFGGGMCLIPRFRIDLKL